LSLARVAVRVNDRIGLLVFRLVDVSWLGFVGFTSTDGSDFAEGGGFPDSIPALRESDVVSDGLGDWVGDVGDWSAHSSTTIGIERSVGIIAAEIGGIT
jgi:hypothetical protein